MPREPIYPNTDSYLEVLEPGGGEVIHHETTDRVEVLIEVLRAAHTFGYGVELRSYWRHDQLDLFGGSAALEWEVTVWKQAADLGRDLEGNLRRAHAEVDQLRAAEVAARAEEKRTVQVVCPDRGSRRRGPGTTG